MKNGINISDNYRKSLKDNLSVLFPTMCKKLTTTVASNDIQFLSYFYWKSFPFSKSKYYHF